MVVDMYHLKIHIILYNYTETKLTIYCILNVQEELCLGLVNIGINQNEVEENVHNDPSGGKYLAKPGGTLVPLCCTFCGVQ